MLESGSDQTTATLAKACGVGRRTIFRDLESLREAGVPLQFDREAGRFSIAKVFFLPPMNFTVRRDVRRMTKSIGFRLDKVAHLAGMAGIYEQLVEAIKKRNAVEIHISWWILGYGDQAEVIRPARLRRLVAKRAWNMAAMYNGDGSTGIRE
jgi:predicted DNA-binding transcriptional regulator YafY